MCFFKKWREKRKAKQALNETPKTEIKTEEVKPVIEKVEEEKVEVSKTVLVEKPKEEIKQEEPKVTQPEDKKQPKPAKYHVSQNKDTNSDSFKKWRVRKEGSTKTIKYFDTQKEAIEFAEDLAQKAESSVVIHKVDGSIRKQDYTKK